MLRFAVGSAGSAAAVVASGYELGLESPISQVTVDITFNVI